MANNIKIVGNILNTTIVSRYDSNDTKLIPSNRINENFGGKNDYIEFYIYDTAGNLLTLSYNYLDYKLPSDTGLIPGTTSPTNTTGNIQTENVGVVSTLATPTSSLYPIIEIDPVQDLKNLGYTSGEYNIRYNLFQNKLSNYIDKALFVKEISQDRKEIRLASITLSNDEIEKTVTTLIDTINNSPYYVDYLLNFGNNEQYVAVNIALNKVPEGYEILFKLYKPLPLNVQEKQTLWISEEIVSPYVFDVNLDKLITPLPGPTLRGPNFGVSIPNQGTVSTTYIDYSTALSSLQSLQNSSYHQILNLMSTQSISINVDYTDFDNFIFFSSAYKRVSNFYDKVKQIEDYTNFINYYTPYVATTASLQTEINQASSSINTLVSQFDGYESYLYFESSSYTWPKSGSLKPYSLLSTGSTTAISWYSTLTGSAQYYDLNNYDNLEYAVPTFIRDDGNNSQYLTFLNMVGHYFDNIWIYLKAVTDINLANNNLNKGISKDLVYNQLQSLGIKLYNSQAGEALDQFLIGANTGSNVWDEDFSITGSYLNNIPRKDLVSELYKRIYHNLPLLLKTKGTRAGLEHLITTFGITHDDPYPSVIICGKEWMATSLNVDRYRNGDLISTTWGTAFTGSWCYYNNDPALGAIYGKMYNKAAIEDPRGLAPAGWRVAGVADWDQLQSCFGEAPGYAFGTIGDRLKEAGTAHWNGPNTGTNSTGLSIRGGGFRDGFGVFQQIGDVVGVSYDTAGLLRLMFYNGNGFDTQAASDIDGRYVYCVRDINSSVSQNNGILNVKEFGGSLKSNLTKGYNNEKVRIVPNSINGDVLSPLLSLQTYPTSSTQFRENDSHYVDISFSPETQIDNYVSDAIASNNPSWSLDDYIGDPRQQYNNSYPDLDAQRKLYFETGVSGHAPFTGSLLDYNGFIRLIQYFDNALFKMLEDFTPERTSLSTGVTISSPILERNKASYANPTNSTTQSVHTAQYSIATINSQYSNFYNTLSSSNNTMGWFDGELSGSIIDVHQYFVDNYNPYLQPKGVINRNTFNHSDWNVLLNNVTASVLSTKRKRIEYRNNFLPTSSLLTDAELQDSYLSLRSYNTSRYEGSTLTSLKYNVYTSGSYTGSNGFTIQTGDKSYGKTAAVDRQSYKVAWVKNIPSQSLNFYEKTQIQLKYLVDKDLNLTDLTLKNNNLFEVQNTFKSDDNVVLSLSDAIKPSFQKTLDGTKSIFRGGYSFDPILYRERNENLTFRYLDNGVLVSSTQRISRSDDNWFLYQVNNGPIYNQYLSILRAAPSNLGAAQLTPTYDGIHGYRWSKNYGNWEATQPMAVTYYDTSTPGNWKYESTIYSSSVNYKTPTNFTDPNPNGILKLIYEFKLLNFNTTDSNFNTDVTDGSNVLFKAPVGATYRIKGTIPVSLWIKHDTYSLFKFFGIVERCSTLSTNDSDWKYVGSTKITDIIGADNLSFDSLTNSVWSPSPPAYSKGVLLCRFDADDSTTFGLGNRYIEQYLQAGEYLRFRFFMYDKSETFAFGNDLEFEIGKNKTSNTQMRGITMVDMNATPNPFIEISDPSVLIPSYNTTATTVSASLFETYNDHIYIKNELYTFSTTSSIFLPSTASSTSNYYSPVIDSFTVQPQDLIRIGSITNPRPDYYTVLNVTQSIQLIPTTGSITTETVFSTWDQNWYILAGGRLGTVPLTEKRSTISVKDTPANRSFFTAVLNSISRQFTVSGLTGTNSTNNITYTLVGGNYYTYSGGYIYMAVSNATTPTVSINAGGQSVIKRVINPNNPLGGLISIVVYDWQSQVVGGTVSPGVSTTFTSNNIIIQSPFTDVMVDRYITGSGNLSQNFAILRPKPDETSVIINFKKSAGDVSQTILIPQDANDVIKANVGTIFQQLNVDLSNQNTNITQ
jgi:uncharacterized protein (TIGR02145 family)